MEFIEKMASSHKQEISDAGQDIKGWMKVCFPQHKVVYNLYTIHVPLMRCKTVLQLHIFLVSIWMSDQIQIIHVEMFLNFLFPLNFARQYSFMQKSRPCACVMPLSSFHQLFILSPCRLWIYLYYWKIISETHSLNFSQLCSSLIS